MGLWARMPMAVAPAMGVNAYFTYNVVGYLATKMVTYEQALAAAFIEGWWVGPRGIEGGRIGAGGRPAVKGSCLALKAQGSQVVCSCLAGGWCGALTPPTLPGAGSSS